jgi:hypothetical protein
MPLPGEQEETLREMRNMSRAEKKYQEKIHRKNKEEVMEELVPKATGR